MHISDLNSKAPNEYNLAEGESIYFNTETERQQNFYEEETYELDDNGSENLEPSDHAMSKMINFEKINRLGDKRRSKSIQNPNGRRNKSRGSADCPIGNSPNKNVIEQIPVSIKEPKGIMSKLSECTNTFQQVVNRDR